MTIKRPKASVVVETCESKISSNKKKNKDKLSSIACSDNSIRKWKVSEAIVPVMSEIDRFSLKILSDKSVNHSWGSLNETFEKNVNFDFQNSFNTSSSVESYGKRASVCVVPLVKMISPIKSRKIITTQIDEEVPVDEINKEISPKEKSDETLQNEINHNSFVSNENKSQEIMEDIDDIHLSSSDDEHVSTKSPSFNEYPSDKPEKTNQSRFGRQAKQTAKENISKQYKLFDELCCPVDIDASQTSNREETLKKTISNVKLSETSTTNESIGQLSKLCDVSKAYLHSQDSSLISSPMEQAKLKSASNLPGRISLVKSDQSANKEEINQSNKQGNRQKSECDTGSKRQFFRFSFCERRRQEMERFTNLINEKPNKEPVPKVVNKNQKSKISPKDGKTKARQRKQKKEKVNSKAPRNLVLSGNSDKDQLDKIVIEDSENDKFNQPIEKVRGGYNESTDDLFSFTPQFVCKRKLKTKIKSKVPCLSRFSEVYDIISDNSSPQKVRKNYLAYKSKKKTKLGEEVIGGNSSLREIMINFESDVNRMKNIQQSMNLQLNQLKKILEGTDLI